MRILLANPNTTQAVTDMIAARAREAAAPGTEIVPATARFGARVIGTRAEMAIAEHAGIDPQILHRVAVIGSGTLDILPHNGAVVTLLSLCGVSHRESYLDIVMTGIVSSLVALVVAILLGSAFGSF